MFSPMTMVGSSLAQAATQTLRPAVTRAATQAGVGASGMKFVPMQSNFMINHGKLTNQLLQAVAKQTRSGDTQQWFKQEQITYISRTVNRAIDDYCMSNNSVIGKETKSHIFKAVESAIKQPLDMNCAQRRLAISYSPTNTLIKKLMSSVAKGWIQLHALTPRPG